MKTPSEQALAELLEHIRLYTYHPSDSTMPTEEEVQLIASAQIKALTQKLQKEPAIQSWNLKSLRGRLVTVDR